MNILTTPLSSPLQILYICRNWHSVRKMWLSTHVLCNWLLCSQELAQSRRDVIQLTTEVEQLRREKADLVGEVEAHKSSVRVWSCDCYHKLHVHNTGRNIVSPATLEPLITNLRIMWTAKIGKVRVCEHAGKASNHLTMHTRHYIK